MTLHHPDCVMTNPRPEDRVDGCTCDSIETLLMGSPYPEGRDTPVGGLLNNTADPELLLNLGLLGAPCRRCDPHLRPPGPDQ